MLYIKETSKEKIKNIKDDYSIITDFDNTLTSKSSKSTWSVLSNVPKEYIEERKKQYNHYHPFELNQNIDYETKNKLMNEWWSKHINLFIKYKLSEEIINEATKMEFRKGAKTFLEEMHKKNIPVYIVSAGIGNFIEAFLKYNDCYYDNIVIYANYIEFKNGIASGTKGNVINSVNKNKVNINIKTKNIILLGDNLDDADMVDSNANTIKIGFLEEKLENKPYFLEKFDIVCIDNTSFDDIKNELFI